MKNNELGIKVIAVLLLSMMLMPASFAASQNIFENTESFQKDALKFDKPKDIGTLDLNGIEQNLNSIKQMEYAGKQVETLKFHINASECSIHPMSGSYSYIKVGDLQPYTAPGEPQLPMKTFIVRLSKDADVQGVTAVSGKYLPIMNKLNIVPVPQPYTWNFESDNSKAGKFIQDERVYAFDGYFPGKVLSYDIGCDNEYKYVFVRVYPLQYIPEKEKAVLINDLTINVYYSEGPECFRPESNFIAKTDAKSVIITPASLYDSAITLANFHNETGMTTMVITTEMISTDYTAATDPPYPGYTENHPGKDNITGYNYELAKKIISYLSDSTAHPDLTYVTIFGNARLIPPSYYYFDEDFYTNQSENDIYNSWIPTDFFYASPDYDLVANYNIGRIPIDDPTQAVSVANKIEGWYDNVDYTWFKNVTLAGGRPFNSESFVGEMATTDVVNMGYLDGMNVEKCFRTDDKFNNATFKNAFSNNGFIYHIGHGSGDSWSLEESPIDVADLKNLPANLKIPIVVSVACMNGAYDTFVMQPEYDTVSIGEEILLSDGGGIAYIGGSRINSGSPLFYYDFGYVTIDKETHLVGILTNVFKAYHDGGHVLGDLTVNATDTFVLENDLENAMNKRALFEFVLLGDPALEIPAQQMDVSYWQPTLIPEDPLKYDYINYGYCPLNRPEQVAAILSTTNSPQVDVKIVEITSPVSENVVITQKNTDNSKVSFNYTSKELRNLIRVVSADEKEGWLYSTTAYPVIFSKSVPVTIDGTTEMKPALFLTDNGDNFPDIWELGICAEWDKQGIFATYQGFDANFLPAIFIMDPINGGNMQITLNYVADGYYTECRWPSFSYDGRYIAYIVTDVDSKKSDNVDSLYVVDLGNLDLENKPFGTEVPEVNPLNEELLCPVWLPSGDIAYCIPSAEGETPNGIYMIKPDGSGKKCIVSEPDVLFHALAASPDGSELACAVSYYEYDSYYSVFNCYNEIYIVSADGSEASERFVYGVEEQSYYQDMDLERIDKLSFSPDGSKLIFSVAGSFIDGKSGDFDLWKINVDGTGLEQVTTDKNSYSPSWGSIGILETQPPSAVFDYSASDAMVQFTDKSTDQDGNIVAVSWDFGDGYRSDEQHPVHTYAAHGTYSVTMIAVDDCNAADIITKEVEITAQESS